MIGPVGTWTNIKKINLKNNNLNYVKHHVREFGWFEVEEKDGRPTDSSGDQGSLAVMMKIKHITANSKLLK